MMSRVAAAAGSLAATLFLVAGCGGSGGNATDTAAPLPPAASLSEAPAGAAASVNRYLWAASLETLDFMPINFADPYGGLITTDWYANPELPQERFRATIYILDSRLRADALRVSIFKQNFQESAGWVDEQVSVQTAAEIENAILTKARELRLNTLDLEQ